MSTLSVSRFDKRRFPDPSTSQLSQVFLQHLLQLHFHAQPPQSCPALPFKTQYLGANCQYPPHHMLQHQNTTHFITTAPSLRLTHRQSSSRDKRRLHLKIIPRRSISAPHLGPVVPSEGRASGVGRGGGGNVGAEDGRGANFTWCGAHKSPGKGKRGREKKALAGSRITAEKLMKKVLQQLPGIPVISSNHAYQSSTLYGVISLIAGYLTILPPCRQILIDFA
ncbi:hypothetical protein B0H34DRAFT_176341 [Crassisporium funariophilum]|nr:hypothetical protein B0H34DRAFT_176341 [Crassisporium funariophilum]